MPADLVGEELDHKCRVVSRLGGGFGDVYLANDELASRQVAIKRVKNTDPDSQTDLVHEIRSLDQLHHPNIVGFHHHFHEDSSLFLVMEHCAGGTFGIVCPAHVNRHISSPNGAENSPTSSDKFMSVAWWTIGGNSPSAKIRGMNEVMLLFSVAPEHYRKVLFVLRHLRKDVLLAAHYIKSHGHLVGPNVEIWEFDLDARQAWHLL